MPVPPPGIDLDSIPDGACILTLTQGYYALVDALDYPIVSQHRWSAQTFNRKDKVYAARFVRVGTRRQKVYLHRQLCGLAIGDPLCDHRNGNGLDNRRSNLVPSDFNRNNHNRAFASAAGYRGVSTDGTKFRAKISIQNDTVSLGTFATAEEAAVAYDNAALIVYGAEAVLNFEKSRHLALLTG